MGLLLAVLVLLALMVSLIVYLTIADAGDTNISEIIRKSTINYLQTAALAAEYPYAFATTLRS